jgi:hypothetical protein
VCALASPSSFRAFPAFFQGTEEADRRGQVKWLQENLELNRLFFCHLLDLSEIDLDQWMKGETRLKEDRLDLLKDFWQLNLHVLSLLGFRLVAARELFDAAATERPTPAELISSPPWAGKSMREYVAHQRKEAIHEATRWITSFRFSDPYAVS